MAAWQKPQKPGVQSLDPTQPRPLARPGQVDEQDRRLREVGQRFEESQRFDVVTYDGAMPRDGALILVDAAAGPVTIALAPAAKQRDRTVAIKKIDASANIVTIDADGTDLIDGAGTATLAFQWECITIASNGEGWFIL